MENNFEKDDLLLNLSKIFRIVLYRYKLILFFVFLAIVMVIALFNILPKKYEVQAELLINKANSTNLADINPFVMADFGSAGQGNFSSILGGSNSLVNEVEILKSPLVLEPVIRENSLIYKKGRKKNKLLSVNDFLERNTDIEDVKGSNVINISYSSDNPETAFKVVDSIIKNYRKIYENINSKKASSDRAILENTFQKAQKNVAEKANKLKEHKSRSESHIDSSVLGLNGLLSLYDKRINKNLKTTSREQVESKSLEDELVQATEEQKTLKTKYEWSVLVENISKNATNVTIIKQPTILDYADFSEPNLPSVILLSIVISSFLAFSVIFAREKFSSKLSIIDMEDNWRLNSKRNLKQHIKEAALDIALCSSKLCIISLTGSSAASRFIKDINVPNIEIFNKPDFSKECLDLINNSESVIFVGEIGSTNKYEFNNLAAYCKNNNKKVLKAYILS
ncbi:MAG: Wzz/FepE/Etk N-terminal domain-containing protein [Candidatus Gastranaerophilales bacterium]|nr:Wzz/FepE/Etk N-terminal domain-containing protein [Candidatus Gastranaerophilales bacterium]